AALSRLHGANNGASPDLIILDWNLPDLHGRAVLSEIKAHPASRATPVLVLSSSSHEPDILEAYRMGAAAYLVRPAALAELGEMLQATIQFWSEIAILPPRMTAGMR